MLNKLFIFAITFFTFLFVLVGHSLASTLSLSPATTTIPQGSIVSVQVRLNTQGESINGVSAYLTYPKDLLEVSSISYGSSAFGIAAESSFGGGSIKISRGSISGATGNVSVGTINFKGKTQGKATVSFITGSGAPRTANSTDSLNLGGSASGAFTIGPPKVIVPPKDIVIKDVLVSLVSTNSATITWTTEEESDSTIEYGLSEGRYILSSYDKTPVKEHKMVIGENLVPGEAIYFRVKSESSSGEGTGKEMAFQLKGYTVKVTVVDSNNNPVKDAEVTLYSIPVKQTTDQQGIVTFTDVSPTRHLVVVKADNIETSKEIDVTEDNLSEFTLIINTSTGSNNTLTTFYLSLAVIICLIAIGIIIILRRKKNSTPSVPPMGQ